MTPFIQASAEDDILRQVEWYAEQGVPDVARRFQRAVTVAIEALCAMPSAGAPQHPRNPDLAGLRTWAVKGFQAHRVYYLDRSKTVIVLRVLHDKRDLNKIIDTQTVER